MSRQRMLSPKFFTDAKVCSLPPLTRLLFQALWCEADRLGRLADEPIDLKIRYLAMDVCDVDSTLAELDRVGLIQRYEVDGKRLIQIGNFLKHQHPHFKEAASTLPAPGKPRARPVKTGASPSESESESESESVKGLRAKKPPAPPKPVKAADPRHAPLVSALVLEFQANIGTTPRFDGREAKAVKDLLALAEPAEVEARWRRALRRAGFPTIRAPHELVKHWDHFATDSPAAKPSALDPSPQTSFANGDVRP